MTPTALMLHADFLFNTPVGDMDEVRMSTALEALESEVLRLTPADRSHLLERLIASLDRDPEVEEAWELEADRREAELESGAVAAVPGQDAITRLRAKLRG